MIYILLLFQALIASGTHIIAKIVVKDIDPVTLTFTRSVMAAIGLLMLSALRRTKLNFKREDFSKIMFLSFLAIPVNQFLFLTAIKYTTASNAALLYGTTPAVVLVLSTFMRLEKAGWKKISGVAIAFTGIVIVVFEKGINFKSEYTVGNLLLVVAVLAWALYTVKGKPMILKYGAFKTSAATMIFGTIMYIPVGIYNALSFDYGSMTVQHWGGLIYLAFGTSIFAYLLWYYALSRIETTKVAVFANVQPVLTTILSVLFLGQVITPAFIIGGSIALTGVVIAQLG